MTGVDVLVLSIWAIIAIYNLVIFLRIDKDAYWNAQTWVLTIVCAILFPIAWAVFAIIWQHNRNLGKKYGGKL